MKAGIYDVFVSASEDVVLVDSTRTTSDVHALLESTGLPVFFKGFGSKQSSSHTGKLFGISGLACFEILFRSASSGCYTKGETSRTWPGTIGTESLFLCCGGYC